MVEEIVARIEQMEKNQLELHEILAWHHKEHHEKMAQMMQVIMRMPAKKEPLMILVLWILLLELKGLLKASWILLLIL